PEFVRDATELACLEMIRAGVSVFNDMYFYASTTAEVTKKAGLRAVLGTGILEFPTPEAKTVDECFEKAEEFIRSYQAEPLIVPAVAPHAPYTCSPETYERAFALAEKYGTIVHTHLGETRWEVEEIKKRYGRSPFEHMDAHGFLRPNLLVAHAVWPSEAEIELMAEKGVKVAHCPESNLKLASGVSPVAKMLQKGVTVCLGTDGAASNNNLDIMEEMATAAKLHKVYNEDPTAIDAKTALKMATINGAKALGIDDRIGSLEPGKEADLVVINLRRAHLSPLYNIYSHLVYTARASDISHLIVRGKLLLDDGQVLTLNEEEILEKARRWAEKIIQ
ncbi:MAG: S-adenosylhomocysteine deaminase, partial [Nitrospirae bacterium]